MPIQANKPSEIDDDIPEGVDETETIDPIGILGDPYDPEKIRVERKTPSIDIIAKRMEHGEINLAPDFQRNEVWTDEAKSRLIESILIRIPLPAFYVDATDEDYWLVVDGLQRLTAINKFVVEQSLRLRGLEFLEDFEGKTFDDLPRNLQRRILETELTIFLIQPGTPMQVKFNVFKRINTGGLPLSAQEIRNAINGPRVREFILKMVGSVPFQRATKGKIGDKRMADRECICRFFAFELTPPHEYKGKDLDSFINGAMARLDDPQEFSDQALDALEQRFYRAMDRANAIFGKYAFRKYDGPNSRMNPISKALFESVSHGLARLTDDDAAYLIRQRESLMAAYAELMKEPDFRGSISQATGGASQVQRRFDKINELFQNFLTP